MIIYPNNNNNVASVAQWYCIRFVRSSPGVALLLFYNFFFLSLSKPPPPPSFPLLSAKRELLAPCKLSWPVISFLYDFCVFLVFVVVFFFLNFLLLFLVYSFLFNIFASFHLSNLVFFTYIQISICFLLLEENFVKPYPLDMGPLFISFIFFLDIL